MAINTHMWWDICGGFPWDTYHPKTINHKICESMYIWTYILISVILTCVQYYFYQSELTSIAQFAQLRQIQIKPNSNGWILIIKKALTDWKLYWPVCNQKGFFYPKRGQSPPAFDATVLSLFSSFLLTTDSQGIL